MGQEPVQGGVEFVLVGVGNVQFLGQRRGVPIPRGGQLGAGKEDLLHDHRQRQVALTAGLRGQKRVESQLANHPQDGLDVAVRQGAKGTKRVLGGDEFLPLQAAANEVDGRLGQSREVAQGFVEDLVALAVGPAEEVGLVHLALVLANDRGYMYRILFCIHAIIIRHHVDIVNRHHRTFTGYIWKPNIVLIPYHNGGCARN